MHYFTHTRQTFCMEIKNKFKNIDLKILSIYYFLKVDFFYPFPCKTFVVCVRGEENYELERYFF